MLGAHQIQLPQAIVSYFKRKWSLDSSSERSMGAQEGLPHPVL